MKLYIHTYQLDKTSLIMNPMLGIYNCIKPTISQIRESILRESIIIWQTLCPDNDKHLVE